MTATNGPIASTMVAAGVPRSSDSLVSVLVMAKAPVPGRVKTRLCPPCTPVEAAMLAEAALADTLENVLATGAPIGRKVVVLDGQPGPWLPPGFEVIRQLGGSLDERLGHAVAAVDNFDGPLQRPVEGAGAHPVAAPALLIGMDTPQVGTREIEAAAQLLLTRGVDAVLGLAEDGGWWALGLRRPDPKAVVGVPMSQPWTGAAQRQRLDDLGLVVADLAQARDVDSVADAEAVAALIPNSRFARALDTVGYRADRQSAGAVLTPAP